MAEMITPDTLPGPDRPLSIGGLVADAADLLRIAANLPRPCSVDVHETCQHINLQFDSDPASYAALAAWAEAFGGVVTRQPWTRSDTGEPVTICRVQFEFYGIAVEALAVIPAAPAAT
jgi:hypothetical protein